MLLEVSQLGFWSWGDEETTGEWRCGWTPPQTVREDGGRGDGAAMAVASAWPDQRGKGPSEGGRGSGARVVSESVGAILIHPPGRADDRHEQSIGGHGGVRGRHTGEQVGGRR